MVITLLSSFVQKRLYSQEVSKHKSEVEEIKAVNEDLRKQNKAYKEDIDDLRSQLWSVGEKLLQEQQRAGNTNELSRQLDKITLQTVDSWVRLFKARLNKFFFHICFLASSFSISMEIFYMSSNGDVRF